MTNENIQITTFLRTEGLEPTIGITTYSPCGLAHNEAVDVAAARMAAGQIADYWHEVVEGKHGRVEISAEWPKPDWYEWRMPDGSIRFTKEQVPPEVK